MSTILSGYTPYSPQQKAPDFTLIRELIKHIKVPVVAEGRIWGPDETLQALQSGAIYVVVGRSITRPQIITERFVVQMQGWQDLEAAKADQIDRNNCNS